MNILDNIRAPLFVPGDRPERFEKAAASGADAVIIDLEDAVSAQNKESARQSLSTQFTQLPILIRINGIGTPWHKDDVSAVLKLDPAAIILPKVEACSDLEQLAASGTPPILALIESARGLSSARSVASIRGIRRVVFGSVDFCADLGCAHTRAALQSARSELVLASRLAGLPPPIDGVTTTIDDIELVENDARYAAELGFSGKLAIHPRQVEAIKRGFQPEPSDIAWAEKVLASGEGAAAVDGAMVDEPVRGRARSILARAVRQ